MTPREPWEPRFAGDLYEDRRAERRLIAKQIAVILLVVALVVARQLGFL